MCFKLHQLSSPHYLSEERKQAFCETDCSKRTRFPHSPVDGIHPIAVRSSYKDPLHICKDSHELPPADWNVSAMHRERFWFQHNFFSVLFRRLQVNPPFWSADSQVTSLDRAMRERHLNMKNVREKSSICSQLGYRIYWIIYFTGIINIRNNVHLS